jgi:hypothetical protein
MVERLLAADEPVAVIVLGAAHDLADQFEGKRVEYKRIVPSRVEYFLEN